jgi:hypothetical protein
MLLEIADFQIESNVCSATPNAKINELSNSKSVQWEDF